jgi:hypothetical protein
MMVSENFISNMALFQTELIRTDCVPTGAGEVSRSERCPRGDTDPVGFTVSQHLAFLRISRRQNDV